MDPTPAVHAFIVEAPWWRNPVVAGPGLLIIAIALFQSARVVQGKRKLQESVDALSSANNELFQVNVDLQREQVLERLRGQAQGMQSSEDIKPVVEAVYRELTGLGLPLINTGFAISLSETEAERWTTGEDGRALEPFTVERDIESPRNQAQRRGDDYYHRHEEGDDARAFFRRTVERGNPRWKGVPEEQWPQKVDSHCVFFEGGSVLVSSEEPIAEEYLMLIKRFGEVFGYAHSRYKELQEKEAQNQELKNQNVLERLRGQAQGMQSSDDIGLVVENVFRELKALHSGVLTAGVTISRTDGTLEIWRTQADGSVAEPVLRDGPLGFGQDSDRRVEAGEPYTHLSFEGEECRTEIQRLRESGNPYWVTVPEERWPERFDAYSVVIPEGNVLAVSEESIPDETLMMVKRFGEVFGFAHSRWQELMQKEAQNRRLAVEASVQRLRAEVQSMDEAGDFERILSLLTASLKTVELSFDGCEIDVQDEPVENPTMEMFEANGYRYTTFRLDPDGNVAPRSYNVAAPFPSVIEQTIERFIADEPWQGLSDEQRIVEVPAGSYGRLRLTASERDSFTDDEVATLREFADAVALGYARYLDIREIQEATERKSAFLASMSHEFRTPMNAIKGFTNLVLGRRSENLNDQQRENLGKVSQASDHLLGMINDLLDLSKIEAGRMDVTPERFDMRELVTSACDTVSPLIQDGVELRQDVADDIGEANTDKAWLQQMVINLLSNAIKFTVSGMVTVTARNEKGEERSAVGSPVPGLATEALAKVGSRIPVLVISVSDTGKGIPADELPTIFDEYRQAEGSESSVQKGTGLGLSITKKFAELLGGTIGVESEVGKGSVFTVRVPMEYQG